MFQFPVCPICKATLGLDEALIVRTNSISASLPPMVYHVKELRDEVTNSGEYREAVSYRDWCGARTDVVPNQSADYVSSDYRD